MKKILLALSLLLTLPALAATSYGTGAINDAFTATLVAVNDQICYNNVNLGAKLGTVQWTVVTAGSGAITVQVSKDYGTNAIVGVPLSTLTSAVNANPSTAPWVNNGPVLGTYETPLPGNATNFCILYQTGGTATTITLAPGKPYVVNSVVATLFEQTSAVNTPLSTGALDVSGWAVLVGAYTAGAAGSFVPKLVDDAGAVPAFGNSAYAGTGTVFSWGVSAASSPSVPYPLPKRVQFDSAAVVGQPTRIRIEVRR